MQYIYIYIYIYNLEQTHTCRINMKQNTATTHSMKPGYSFTTNISKHEDVEETVGERVGDVQSRGSKQTRGEHRVTCTQYLHICRNKIQASSIQLVTGPASKSTTEWVRCGSTLHQLRSPASQSYDASGASLGMFT